MEIEEEKVGTSAGVEVGAGFEDGVDSKFCYMQKFRLYETSQVNMILFYSYHWCLHLSCSVFWTWSERWDFSVFDCAAMFLGCCFVCV